MISVSCEMSLGSGDLKKQIFLQVLHTAYTLKGLFPIKSWRDIWLVDTSAVWEDLKWPVILRWEHVGDGAFLMQKYYDNRITVSQYIIDIANVCTSTNDTASYLYSYLNKDVLYAQILFINAYIIEFYDKYSQWYK